MTERTIVWVNTREEMAALLAEQEREHSMTTAEFDRRWQAGDAILDRHELFAWAGLISMARIAHWYP